MRLRSSQVPEGAEKALDWSIASVGERPRLLAEREARCAGPGGLRMVIVQAAGRYWLISPSPTVCRRIVWP